MHRKVTRVIREILMGLIGCGALAAGAHAQSDLTMTFRVPFPFIVGTQNFAPGTYQLSPGSSPFQLSITAMRSGCVTMFPARPEQQSAVEPHGRLLFSRSEGRSVLNEVHYPGASDFTVVIEPRRAGSTNPVQAAGRCE